MDMRKFASLLCPGTTTEAINDFFKRINHSCFWPDGQVHNNEGPAPLIKVYEDSTSDALVIPNPYYIISTEMGWYRFASVSKQFFSVGGVCLSPTKIELRPARIHGNLEMIQQGSVTLLV